MPKPLLKEPYKTLSDQIFETMKAGLQEWRPDLSYPQSASDLEGCIHAVLRMFEVKRRPIGLAYKEIIESDEK